MTLSAAIQARHSVRAYTYQPIAGDTLAVLQQKFHFEYVEFNGESKKKSDIAKKGTSMLGDTHMDLGIAKQHFEIGAGKDNFDWV